MDLPPLHNGRRRELPPPQGVESGGNHPLLGKKLGWNPPPVKAKTYPLLKTIPCAHV